ncbi:MAG: DUF1805 domain-containing protein [Archaeoglobus sp.]|uniref:YunC family protein n=1 Tax=Archaeoglobus sp. TaxID=1872626 RepID=UPI001D9BE70E|nr:DUF1805 domain-containing protein [Archaeoglobus sp.]MBO8179097.1 DUF1805 domain-containing protein [Archaeoglobus sp.]
MIEVDIVNVDGKSLLGLRVELPNAPLLLLLHEKLVVGCGYISAEVMEKMGNAACIVKGVRSFQEMLDAEIAEITSKTEELGLKKGMKLEDALKML